MFVFGLKETQDPSLVRERERELEREKVVRIYHDPKLLRNGRGYQQCVKRLHSFGLAKLLREKRCDVNLFFVKKTSDNNA